MPRLRGHHPRSPRVRSKENTVLRGALNPSIVHVIPNAVVASQFRPAEPVPPVPDIRELPITAPFLFNSTGEARPHVHVDRNIFAHSQSRSFASSDSCIAKESTCSSLRCPKSALSIPMSDS